MSAKYTSRYVYQMRFLRPEHSWELVGRCGGLHLHIQDSGDEHAAKYGDRYSGGLEIHYRQPPDFMRDNAPSHSPCWLLHCPCWHDGTSLYVSERIIPMWNGGRMTPDEMFRFLEREADERFLAKDDEP
jgi:hypothetical protein